MTDEEMAALLGRPVRGLQLVLTAEGWWRPDADGGWELFAEDAETEDSGGSAAK